MPACKVRIIVDRAGSEDPIFTVEIRTTAGSLDAMAEVTLSGRALRLNGMHIGGDPSKTRGAAALRDIAQGVMEEPDVDEIPLVGGVRTTGANPGRDARPRRLRRAPQAQGPAESKASYRCGSPRPGPSASRGQGGARAHDGSGEAYVEVPKVEDLPRLVADLEAVGIAARRHGADAIFVRAVREALHLSQAQFALRFGLEEVTVKNWE